jgi:trehalose 6-phosphate phosphatase
VNHLATEPESLFDCLADVATALNSARHVALFLDFDGTLAPIVDDPDQAVMPAESREHLLTLARRTEFRVSVISGRALADVERRVGLRQLIYAGNHGLEIRGPGISFTEPDALSRAPRLKALGHDLKMRLRNEIGSLVEDKGLTLSVHYRKAREADRDRIRRIVAEGVAPVRDLFFIGKGLEVLEIRPRVDWTKGSAVRWILSSSDEAGTLPVVLGDDVTDEDTFSELPDGITVRVGGPASTAAHYRLDYQEGVNEFLAWLVAMKERDGN